MKDSADMNLSLQLHVREKHSCAHHFHVAAGEQVKELILMVNKALHELIKCA